MRLADRGMPLLLYLLIVNGAEVTADGETQEPTTHIAGSADSNETGSTPPDAFAGATLTNGFWGLSDRLADHGIEVAVGSTNVYQTNAKGGLGTHQRSGRLAGSYDVEIAADLEKLLGIGGLGLFIHGQGGWPDAEGIDGSMVGSAFGVNTDAGGSRSLDGVEVIFEWNPADGLLTLMVGKMDFAGVFDASEYANDETGQFLNGALVNNPTMPIPDYCLGVILTFHLTEAWSVTTGIGDAEADGRETGFVTTFDGDDYFFYALETGVRADWDSPGGSLAGNYRLGLWYDPHPKAHSDSEREYRDDMGFYASLDQMLLRESDDPQDSQGLGVFARYGYADEKRNDLCHFWSIGMQYQGLLQGRDDDVLGLGFALGAFSDEASASFTDDYERVLEFYYSVQIAPWVAISPSVQYVTNPGGDGAVADALVVGVRGQISF